MAVLGAAAARGWRLTEVDSAIACGAWKGLAALYERRSEPDRLDRLLPYERCGRNTAETGHATPNKSLIRADAAGCQRRRWDSVSAGVGANSTLGSRSSRVVGTRSGGVRLRVQFPNRRTVWVM